MNNIFADMVDICVIIYLDDILVYTDNINQHRTHVREVLRRLRENGLYMGAHKCSFHQDTVEYLGYILSPSGLTMDPAKVQTIQDWPEQRKIKEIQSFLGFTNFYHRCHIPVSRTQYQDYNYDFTRFFYWTTTPYEYLMTFIRITYIIRLILIPNSLAETVNP